MLSHTQKRVLKYVEAGSFLKLKSYLRKHKDVDVNFSQGKKERTPLHVSCSRGDDLVLRLLLKHGAEVLRKDRKGDTVLHIAANRALKHGRTGESPWWYYLILKSAGDQTDLFNLCLVFVSSAYEDLVIPLRNSCPEAMQAPNSAGVTPEDLLQWMKDDQVGLRFDIIMMAPKSSLFCRCAVVCCLILPFKSKWNDSCTCSRLTKPGYLAKQCVLYIFVFIWTRRHN